MNFLNAIFCALACLSLTLACWQWLAARRFPLHQRIHDSSFAPTITLLKPLKGRDHTTGESLGSWFQQDYSGPLQILFGVADANDPACELVQDLMLKHPGHDVQLVICRESLGANAKVSTLIQLEALAKYPLILISDADVRAPADFLANLVVPLRDEKTGLVNCFYRLANPASLAMRWEAIAINADFWSQVLQSISLKPLDFALGAAILMRREALNQIGGFAALADCLADDYQLGHRIARKGHHIALCPVVVECWDAPMNWRQVWKHQLRWARTIRVCQPLPYFSSILANTGLWAGLWLVVSMLATGSIYAPLAALAILAARILLAQNLQLRFTPDRRLVSPWWLVPVKDWLQFALWVGAFSGNTVEWRGQRMRLRRDGTLEDGGH